jgi:hypothetical protein
MIDGIYSSWVRDHLHWITKKTDHKIIITTTDLKMMSIPYYLMNSVPCPAGIYTPMNFALCPVIETSSF